MFMTAGSVPSVPYLSCVCAVSLSSPSYLYHVSPKGTTPKGAMLSNMLREEHHDHIGNLLLLPGQRPPAQMTHVATVPSLRDCVRQRFTSSHIPTTDLPQVLQPRLHTFHLRNHNLQLLHRALLSLFIKLRHHIVQLRIRPCSRISSPLL